jgi:hypothetical protein
MDDSQGYPIVRAVFILLIALVLLGDLAFLLKMSSDIFGAGG